MQLGLHAGLQTAAEPGAPAEAGGLPGRRRACGLELAPIQQ